jgi:hypothetical protein
MHDSRSTDELVEPALHPLGASRWLGTEPDQVVGSFATFALPGDTYVAGTIVEVDDEHVMVQTVVEQADRAGSGANHC